MIGVKFYNSIVKVETPHKIGEDPKADLKLLLKECKEKLPSVNEKFITKVFNFVLKAHENKVRKSGDPYYTHPLAVARIVVNEVPLDETSVAAALLHDVCYTTEQYDLKYIRTEFGNAVADIVDGVTKIKNIESYNIDQLNQIENYRKLLLSLIKDVRIIMIKLADRLHNMRTIKFLPPERQEYLAKETMEIYAPFANRVGLRNLKWELEDLSFKTLNREAYYTIKDSLRGTRTEREKYVDEFSAPIIERLQSDDFLKKNKIKFEISGRAKHIYSIFNKMLARQKGIDELYDLFAIRIILNTDDPFICFYVYGIIASIYQPVPLTFKDYISAPKKNGYQSLHTAVIGQDGKPVEVQLRTKAMHDFAEQGVAAHFRYKSGINAAQSVLEETNIQEWLDLVREVFENVGDEEQYQLLESLSRDLFPDEIYVFTPTNEFKTLLKGSTPLDFAYNIHSEVGNRCIGAKVNGRVVPLDYVLQSGDQIEILTSKSNVPAPEWLNFVVTSKAKSAIHKFLKEENKRLEREGKRIWEEKLQESQIKFKEEELGVFIASSRFRDINEFYLLLAKGELNPNKALQFLQYKTQTPDKTAIDISKTVSLTPHISNFETQRAGMEYFDKMKKLKEGKLPVIYGKCCNPLPGDRICGIISLTGRLTIHKNNCEIAQNHRKSNAPGWVEIDWPAIEGREFIADIRIIGEDRPAMLNQITSSIISCNNTNINGISFDTVDNNFQGLISVNIQDVSHLNDIFNKLKSIKGVKIVERV